MVIDRNTNSASLCGKLQLNLRIVRRHFDGVGEHMLKHVNKCFVVCYCGAGGRYVVMHGDWQAVSLLLNDE